ncbi:MAG: PAS domain-containing protein [Bacteroidia bacterium]|nr:PAS domain-containing protein [Bacteroidia bacterium]MDW8089259.1 PAS domain S-box protein [Bacteroidia bacterium]
MASFWQNLRGILATSAPSSEAYEWLPKLAALYPAPVFLISKSRDRFLWVSPSTLALVGQPSEALLQVSPKAFLEENFAPSEILLNCLLTEKAQQEVEVTYLPAKRILRGYWINIEKEVFALVFQDVTELRQAQEELVQYAEELRQQVDLLTDLRASLEKSNQELAQQREQLRLLAAVAAYTDNAVIITDVRGQILWVNRGFERISGYTLQEVKGKIPGRLLQGPDTDPATVQRIREKLQRKEPFTEEILNYTKDGRPYWLRLYITPLTNEMNEVTHFIAIEMDITEEKKRIEQLEARMRDLADAQRYAARIFQRFLPPVDRLKAYFSEVAIWNEPLHEVGGDFYFYSPQEGQVIIALGDSTGHGAAAALISVYALTALASFTKDRFDRSLEEIYDELLEGIIFSSEGKVLQEGFELALLRYNLEDQSLEYLGARRPLWIFRGSELYELEPARTDISTMHSTLRPPLRRLILQKRDRLYLFSDGIPDQLGVDNKKFSLGRLRSFLQLNQYLPVPEQINLLRQALKQWQGSNPQTDDRLIIALEV